MLRFALVLCVIAALGACSTHPTAPAGAVSDLAPTGKLRAAINFGNPVLASKDPATGEPRGVSVDLSRELAARLGVPVELVAYAAAGRVVEGLKTQAWDVAYVAIDPARGVDMVQSPPYVLIEGSYLVPAESPIRSNAEVDREGVRVVVGKGSAYDLFLSRELKRATIVGETTHGGANPTTIYRITDHFSASIPFARSINPVTKTDLEGAGVKPDVAVPADQALLTAHLLALKKSLKKNSDDRDVADSLKRTIAEKEKELTALKVKTAKP